MITFFIEGIPGPQGSKRHVGNGVMVESSKKVAPWRGRVMHAARAANWLKEPLDEPVRVIVDFYLPAPKKSKFGDKPAGPPDLDKLLRSTFDGLTSSCVIKDDARIVEVSARKHWATDVPGAAISIEPLEAPPEPTRAP